jgi:DNA-binding NarL/FixJ family response regulator
MDERMGSVVHRAETLARWALMADRADRPGGAGELAAQALRLSEPIGYTRITRLLDGLHRGDAPDNLTDREVDVLRLLAGGLSNREIGRQLFISSHTAANHVRNILIKTQAANRTQAAMYAAEHHLV